MFVVVKSFMKFIILVVMLFTFDNKKAAMNNNMIAIVSPFVSNKYMNGNKINRYTNDTRNIINKMVLNSLNDQESKKKYKRRLITKEITVDNKDIIIEAKKRAKTIFPTGRPVVFKNSGQPVFISSANKTWILFKNNMAINTDTIKLFSLSTRIAMRRNTKKIKIYFVFNQCFFNKKISFKNNPNM